MLRWATGIRCTYTTILVNVKVTITVVARAGTGTGFIFCAGAGGSYGSRLGSIAVIGDGK
jgi:hypothetical protein